MAIMPPLPQTLTLNALQGWVEDMKAANGWTPVDFRHEFAGLVEEVGELAKAHRKVLPTAHLTEEQRKMPDSIGEELADVLIYLLSLATVAGVDFETAFAAKIEKNRNREWTKNNAS